MKRRITWGSAAGLILAATAAGSVPAHAAGFTGPCSPGIGRHAATTTLTNRPDGGGAGNTWATDGLTRTLSITLLSQTGSTWNWSAKVCDGGGFQDIAGQLAPNQGAGHAGQVITRSVSGTVSGTATYQFSTDQPLNTSSNLGVLPKENGAPATPAETTSLWFEQAFPASTVFTGPGITTWAWSYAAGRLFGPQQKWYDANDTNGQAPDDGQIK